MRGFLISGLSIGGVLFFSVCLFLSSSLSIFWLFLELGTLSLVPLFFLYGSDAVLSSLFSYLVVSSISSTFIICGFLFESMSFFTLVGFMIKFGIFPFFGWVYNILLGSNWFVIWGLSTFLKSAFLFFPFFMSSGGEVLLSLLCGSTLLLLTLLFWVYSYSWAHCWSHMMISSSAALMAMSLVGSLENLFWLFLVYIVWASLVLLFFSLTSMGGDWKPSTCFIFCFLLLSLPCSVSVFYKFLMAVSIFSCAFFVGVCWAVYSVSEQLYLVSFVVNRGFPRMSFGSLKLV